VAEKRLADLGPRAETALREARMATAELQNQHEEISSADLHQLAATLINDWQQAATPDSVQVGLEHDPHQGEQIKLFILHLRTP
jgi:hypothetical protein